MISPCPQPLESVPHSWCTSCRAYTKLLYRMHMSKLLIKKVKPLIVWGGRMSTDQQRLPENEAMQGNSCVRSLWSWVGLFNPAHLLRFLLSLFDVYKLREEVHENTSVMKIHLHNIRYWERDRSLIAAVTTLKSCVAVKTDLLHYVPGICPL